MYFRNVIEENDTREIINSNFINWNIFNNSTVLITGATGLIGSQLVKSFLYANEKLNLNIKIVAHVRNKKKAIQIIGRTSNVKYIVQDIKKTKIRYRGKIDYIIHTANSTSSKSFTENPVETINTIVKGTQNILELAKNKSVKSLIYLSSMEIYGICNNNSISEKDYGYLDISAPRSSYPEAKRLCETLCISYHKEFGLPVKIARLVQTLGAGVDEYDNRVFSQFARSVANDEAIVLHTEGKSVRNYCYITDTISGILVILEKGSNGECYNIANKETSCSIKEMAEMLCKKYPKTSISYKQNDTNFYLPPLKNILNTDKLEGLDWKALVPLEEMYSRLINSFKLKLNKTTYGILSFNITTRCYNFGAALHSYAFQTYLTKKGIKSVIINYKRENNGIRIYNFLPILIKKFKFEKFFKKNCIITPKTYNKKNINNINFIDRYICETDITWARFKHGFDRVFMCDYPNMQNKNNIAFSVDFGSNEFTKDDIKALQKYSNNFKYISIRNIFKLDYIRKALNRNDIITTIDPVLLLDKSDYARVSKKIIPKRKYVLVYNCKENNPEMVNIARKYAKENNLDIKIINCWDSNVPKKKLYIPTAIGVEEFLGEIEACERLFTNSYHGICFSLIYEKPFYAFARVGNNEKILTILKTFHLENRLIEHTLPTDEIDYSYIKTEIAKLKADAEEFIEQALKG